MEEREATPELSVRIHAHAGLRRFCEDRKPLFCEIGAKVIFVDPCELGVLTDPADVILVPATSQMQIELLRSLRQRCCMISIVAVVNDVIGYQTYQAMSAGATCIFNLAIPVNKQVTMLQAIFTAHAGVAQRLLRLVSTGPAVPEGSVDQTRCTDEVDTLLVTLLCGTPTVASIAKRFYCSERSMYRRVRRIYDRFGVSGRNELRAAVAVSRRGAQHVS